MIVFHATALHMMVTTKKELAVLMAAVIAIVGAIATSTSIGSAEAIAINEKGVKADGQVIQEAGHWGTVNYVNQEACSNEANQMKAPEDRGDRVTDFSIDNQVQEVGTQSTECGDVSQSAEITSSVVDESTTNDESTTINSVSEGDPIPDIG
jgi:hypothetical protein